MKYPYIVNKDGVWYPAGADVPAVTLPTNNKEDVTEIPFLDNSKVETERTYTKTEINRMSTDSLRKLATEVGIANAEGTNGADLKKILIKKFGL